MASRSGTISMTFVLNVANLNFIAMESAFHKVKHVFFQKSSKLKFDSVTRHDFSPL